MNVLVLGRGKTGSLVAEVARERKHHVQAAGSAENSNCAALTEERLRQVDIVIDFTAPHCVVQHIEASARAGKNMVVGTTGWYGELSQVKKLVEGSGIGLVWGANFSIGVNLFFDIVRASAGALRQQYMGQIFERHHVHKKDAPSGTAIVIQKILTETAGKNNDEVEIVSFREGEVVGLHEVVFESDADRIYLCHDAKSRRGFAEGAVRAAEWLTGKKGLYEFKDVWREM
ncbi:MAG TPA: 4-hydroxy-tetrahydrodipicolinate reductase [Candidatus Sulfotelmatobacter sp.]|nr:4-hydroxy-tetrahydrodipicolinate reductase [Candidatus Sulfotelmatobacter sp.]